MIEFKEQENIRLPNRKMSGYKHYYFDFRARGEISRLAFAAANTEFEDVRLQPDEWTKEKACK